MRVVLIFICLTVNILLSAQPLKKFNGISKSVDKPMATDELLLKLDWTSIEEYCRINTGYYASKTVDGLLTKFEYHKQGYDELLEIVSYKGQVLQFSIYKQNRKNRHKPFFNGALYLSYVREMMPNLPDSLLLTDEESAGALTGFYSLLGLEAADEYGWICEYSTVGMPPDRRRGLIILVDEKRVDLFRKLMDYENPQVRLYAIDALIYLDTQLNVLTEQDWSSIYKFRDSGAIITTCGNMGSYKTYKTPVSDLLSKEAIESIPEKYDFFKRLGYLRQ